VDDKKFVFEVSDLLAPYLGRDSMFMFEKRPSLDGPFLDKIKRELVRSNLVLIFVGKRFDEYISFEALLTSTLKKKPVIVVDIGGRKDVKDMPDIVRNHLLPRAHILKDNYTDRVPPDTIRCAKEILETLEQFRLPIVSPRKLRWKDEYLRFGLPASPYIFDYEKDMIRFYVAKQCYELLDQGMSQEDAAALQRRYQSMLNDWTRIRIKQTLDKGIAADWPAVHSYEAKEDNPLKKATFRSDEDRSFLRAAALVGLDAPDKNKPLLFPEAGPRPKVALPAHKRLNVAIIVAGGIAPGINAVIDAIVQRHYAYHIAANQSYDLEIIGLKNGLLAIEKARTFSAHSRRLSPTDTVEHATRGGSMLGTSRDEELLNRTTRFQRIEDIAKELRRQSIDVLYVIGGDGSMKAAHALWRKVSSSSEASRMSVVAIPKTMDNDILWVWQSFGFLSAVEEARDIVERLHTEVRSNPRLGIVQFFGSGSGFVVSHAVLAAATGHTTLALIPEMDFSVIGVALYLKRRLWDAARPSKADSTDPAAPIDPRIPHGLIVMAETAIPVDARECLGLCLEKAPDDLRHFYQALSEKIRASEEEKEALRDFFDRGRRVQGQTSDDLRSLGIKILREALPILIKSPELNNFIPDPPGPPGCEEPDWGKLRMVRNEPRYLVRALEPSTSDIINGQRLGLLAVDAAMAGYTDCMISQWLTEFAIVPLDLVVLGRKRIPPNGMFWNSVVAKTHQPSDLVSPYQEQTTIPKGKRESRSQVSLTVTT
jgi:6-phosphofructokinase